MIVRFLSRWERIEVREMSWLTFQASSEVFLRSTINELAPNVMIGCTMGDTTKACIASLHEVYGKRSA
jgi:hypothetical protein